MLTITVNNTVNIMAGDPNEACIRVLLLKIDVFMPLVCLLRPTEEPISVSRLRFLALRSRRE